eukprot:233128-Amphidinium_carterae.1
MPKHWSDERSVSWRWIEDSETNSCDSSHFGPIQELQRLYGLPLLTLSPLKAMLVEVERRKSKQVQ